jgi:hypothetical protein
MQKRRKHAHTAFSLCVPERDAISRHAKGPQASLAGLYVV